jgi:hypothetical protein
MAGYLTAIQVQFVHDRVFIFTKCCLTLHYTTLHCTTLHDTTLHYTTLHYTALHYTALHYTALHHTTLRCTTLHYTLLPYTTLHYTTLHYTTLHYTTLHYGAKRFLSSPVPHKSLKSGNGTIAKSTCENIFTFCVNRMTVLTCHGRLRFLPPIGRRRGALARA